MPSQNAPAPVHKKTWTEVPLKNDSKPATPTSDGDWELLGGKDVQKQAEMTLPAKSPYVEDKTLEDVRILERQSKSEIDPEHWEVATLAGRQRKATILSKLLETEDAIQEEIVRLIRSFKNLLGDSKEEEEAIKVLEGRKEAIKRAREVVDDQMEA